MPIFDNGAATHDNCVDNVGDDDNNAIMAIIIM